MRQMQESELARRSLGRAGKSSIGAEMSDCVDMRGLDAAIPELMGQLKKRAKAQGPRAWVFFSFSSGLFRLGVLGGLRLSGCFAPERWLIRARQRAGQGYPTASDWLGLKARRMPRYWALNSLLCRTLATVSLKTVQSLDLLGISKPE